MHIFIVLFPYILIIVILLYNKTIVDFCFSEPEVLLNSKLFIIDLRFASVNMKFSVQ